MACDLTHAPVTSGRPGCASAASAPGIVRPGVLCSHGIGSVAVAPGFGLQLPED